MQPGPFNKRWRSALIIVLALLNVQPAALQVVQYHHKELQPLAFSASLPGSRLPPLSMKDQGDLDQDGQDEYLCLVNGRAAIQPQPCAQAAQPLWQSPAEWQVNQALLSDLNRDGRLEAALLVWRPFRSWPIDEFLPFPGRIKDFHDRQGQSCHIILIGWSRGGYRERWAGSALARPLLSFAAADVDGNGHADLVALEGEYDLAPPAAAGRLTAWEWNGFGFTLLASAPGSYRRFTLLAPSGPAQPVLVLAE